MALPFYEDGMPEMAKAVSQEGCHGEYMCGTHRDRSEDKESERVWKEWKRILQEHVFCTTKRKTNACLTSL